MYKTINLETHTTIKPKADSIAISSSKADNIFVEAKVVDWTRIYGRAAKMRAQELRDARDARRSDWD